MTKTRTNAEAIANVEAKFPNLRRNKDMTTEKTLHAFEKAGLGTAPFYCVGMCEIPSTSLAEANPAAYQMAMAYLPHDLSIGSCAYCGMGIKYNFIVKGATGRRFVVGSECVNRTGDAGLVKTVKAERTRIAREKRDVRRSQAAAERRAAYEAERKARAAAFEASHTDLIKRARAVTDIEAKGGFIADIIMGGLAGRYVSDKALAAVMNAVADLERRASWNSSHLGTVGKRETFNVEVDRVAYFEGAFGIVWIVTMRDEVGNAIVSKSTAFRAERGKKLTIKATIKEHSEFRGERQTIVQRIKVAA